MTNQSENSQQGATGHESEGYITKAEVAKRVKKTLRTVENWQRDGILPFIKVGRSVLFKWSDVEQHLQSHYRVCRRTITK
jgi:excisionase family DNA binding protein